MMGGVHTDIDGATAAARAVRRRRDRLRQHQRRQPAGLELAAGVPGVRRPRRAGRAPTSPPARADPDAAVARRRRRTSGAGSNATCCTATAAGSRIATIREQMQADPWRRAPGSTATADIAGQGRRQAARAAGARSATAAHRRPQPDVQHRADRRRSSSPACSTWPRHRAQRACAARSRAARTSAPTSRHATTSSSWPIRWCTATPDGAPRGRVPAGHDHPLAAGRAGLREVDRGRPASPCRSPATGRRQDAEPTFAGLRRAAAQGLGGPRRPELHQGRASTARCRTAGPAGWASAAAAA